MAIDWAIGPLALQLQNRHLRQRIDPAILRPVAARPPRWIGVVLERDGLVVQGDAYRQLAELRQ